jgi:carboxyl-terminal processing protease
VVTAPRQVAVQENGIKDGAPAEFREAMPVYWEAWDLVKKNFYKQPVDELQATYGAISGMVETLGDPHTSFLDPKRAEYLRSDLEGSFEGIGATVSMRQGRLTIIAPIKGSPAEKAGLKPGDVILQVDDKPIVNMDLMEAIALIRGKKGTSVRLKIQRSSEPAFDVSVVRDTIQVSTVETRMYEDDSIGYLQLRDFGATATDDLRKALREMLDKKPRAVILDLRDNPGGYLHIAVQVASQFIKADQPVLVEAFKDGTKKVYKSESGGLATEVPIVLLVNGGSASASEILAAALKDYKRATVIGKKTFGKGSVQTSHTLSDQESQLRVTIAHFLSPHENEINDVGVTPDIEVENPTEFELSRGRDPQLEKAIETIKSGALDKPANGTTSFNLTDPTPAGAVAALSELSGRVLYDLSHAVFRV